MARKDTPRLRGVSITDTNICQPLDCTVVFGGIMKPEKKSRALIDLTDEALADRIREEAEHVKYSYDALLEEIRRRSQDRSTKAMVYLTWAIVALGLLQVVATFINLFKHQG